MCLIVAAPEFITKCKIFPWGEYAPKPPTGWMATYGGILNLPKKTVLW